MSSRSLILIRRLAVDLPKFTLPLSRRVAELRLSQRLYLLDCGAVADIGRVVTLSLIALVTDDA